jgi:hypothetical protein
MPSRRMAMEQAEREDAQNRVIGDTDQKGAS